MSDTDEVVNISGVSRSGRIRKKSTKLKDFQEDLDLKPVKRPKPVVGNGRMDDTDSLSEDGERGDDYLGESSVNRSIYMQEQSNKRKIMGRDGKILLSKAQRKDKGKSRITAYMLWAKDVRHQMRITHPDMDFAAISKRLGEMWSNVPNSERHNLKRKAKRWSKQNLKTSTLGTKTPVPSSSKFLNKGTGLVQPQSSTSTAQPIIQHTIPHNNFTQNQQIMREKVDKIPKLKLIKQPAVVQRAKPQSKTTAISHSTQVSRISSEPIDIAAHLKLLGDNLSVIGENLKNHEGQIAVSGGLSVLLDSLLCSLGPLMCLTTHINGFGHRVRNIKGLLHNTLDNIAYVMPGL